MNSRFGSHRVLLAFCILLVFMVGLGVYSSSLLNAIDGHVFHETIEIDGAHREYRLVIPNDLDSKSSIPVVFALHGALDTVDEMATYTGLDESACEHDFLLVYLQGRHLNWPPSIPPENPDFIVPDLRFFESMCDLMVKKYSADANRIYVVGVSQGGAMANVLTTKCSQRIAATVCNCGWLPRPLGDEPLNTAYKCSIMFISGTDDRQVEPRLVQAACSAFTNNGHPTTFHSMPGKGHGWNGVNELAWSFLRDKRKASANE